MNDSALPAITPPLGGFPAPAQQQAPQQQPFAQQQRAPGRPPDDPIKQEERLMKHTERKRVESVLPKRATEAKLLVYPRTKEGRVKPGTKPILTILVSEMEEAIRDGAATPEEYLESRIVSRRGDERAPGTYEILTVDKRGTRLPEIPSFDITVGPDEEESENPEDSEESMSPEEQRELEALEREERGMDSQTQFQHAAHQQMPPQGAPPPPSVLDLGRIEDVSKRNRDEAKAESQQTMAMIMQMMAQNAQAQQASNNSQTQMFLAMMERMNQRPEKTDTSGNIAAVLAAIAPLLAPVIAKMVETKPTDPLMLELLRRDKDKTDPSAALLQQLPLIMGKVAEQQMALQATGARGAVEMQAEVNKVMVSSLLATMKETMRNNADLRSGKDDEDKGGGTMEMIGNIAAAVLPKLLGNQQAAQEPPGQAQQAIAAPQPVQQQPAPRPPVPQRPAPPRRDANTRIRQTMNIARDLRSGKVPAERRADVLQFILTTSPPPMLAAIRAGSFEQVVAVGTPAVAADAGLLQWVADSDNQEFLKDLLGDVRLLDANTLTDEQNAAKVAALKSKQGSAPVAAATAPQRTAKAPPPEAKAADVALPAAPPVNSSETPPAAPPAAE